MRNPGERLSRDLTETKRDEAAPSNQEDAASPVSLREILESFAGWERLAGQITLGSVLPALRRRRSRRRRPPQEQEVQDEDPVGDVHASAVVSIGGVHTDGRGTSQEEEIQDEKVRETFAKSPEWRNRVSNDLIEKKVVDYLVSNQKVKEVVEDANLERNVK